MILIHVNLLIYAVNEDAPLHRKASRGCKGHSTVQQPSAYPGALFWRFLRLTTRDGIFRMPLTIESAFDIVGAWLSQPAVMAVEPTAHRRFYGICCCLLARAVI